MNSPKHFLTAVKVAVVTSAALLGTLVGCVSHVARPPVGSVYVAPPAMVVVQEDYVYYPDYQVYYSGHRREYVYLEGRSWVSRPTPPRVTVNVLLASPSVRLAARDFPQHHHATMQVRQAPQKKDKNDRDDDRRGKHGK